MTEIIPASFLVFRELIGTARHAIRKTPEEVATNFNLFIEKSFEDQLGEYEFVGFEIEGNYFGLRQHIHSPKKEYSVVSVLGNYDVKEKKILISKALNLDPEDVFELEIDH